MELDLESLDAKLKEKEEEIRKFMPDKEYFSEMDNAAINICGEKLAEWCDNKKRQQFGKNPDNKSDIAHKMAAHIMEKYQMETSEDQIVNQIINKSTSYLSNGYNKAND